MGNNPTPLTGPDLTQGCELSQIPEDRPLLGHAHGEAVILVRHGGEVCALAAACTHYGGPLAEGLVLDGQVRCPWHHACFDVRTGEAVGPPALSPLRRWAVERRGARISVGQPLPPTPPRASRSAVESVVIVGAGAAGNAAAETLRREGFSGSVTMIGAEPNASGGPPQSLEGLPGRDRDRGLDAAASARVLLPSSGSSSSGHRAVRLDPAGPTDRSPTARAGATARCCWPPAPTRSRSPSRVATARVHALRSLADSRRDHRQRRTGRARWSSARASSAWRSRPRCARAAWRCTVVAPEARPLERVLGAELGDFVRALHEEHGVRFHLGHTLEAVGRWRRGPRRRDLPAGRPRGRGDRRPAGAGAGGAGGAAPRSRRRRGRVPGDERAGRVRRGRHRALAGPAHRRADPGRALGGGGAAGAGRRAQHPGRARAVPRRAVLLEPALRRAHHLRGPRQGWDRLEVAGSIVRRNCLVAYRVAGRISALASIQRDQDSLRAEVLLGRGDQAGLEALLVSARN